jgi:anti-sigma B factor antagonist
VIIEGRPLTEQAVQGRREALPEPFRVETRPDRRRVIVIPRGELDLATVDAVSSEIDELVVRGFEQIVLDLRQLSFMDSTGLRLVLRHAGRADVCVTVIDGPDAVSRLFDLTGARPAIRFEAGT